MVKSGLIAIYYTYGVEALYAAADTYCTGITWVPQGSWENTTAAAQSFTYQFKTELKITQGSAVTTGGLPLALELKGFAMGIDATTKTFSENESTTPQTTPLTINVAPGKKAMLYQRQYNFRTDMYFVLDAASRARNVAAVSGDGLSRKTCVVEIMSGDYLITEKELSNVTTGTVHLTTVNRANQEADRQVCPRSGLTSRAVTALNLIGA